MEHFDSFGETTEENYPVLYAHKYISLSSAFIAEDSDSKRHFDSI